MKSIKHEWQQLETQRLAVACREPSEYIPTIVEVDENLFLFDFSVRPSFDQGHKPQVDKTQLMPLSEYHGIEISSKQTSLHVITVLLM